MGDLSLTTLKYNIEYFIGVLSWGLGVLMVLDIDTSNSDGTSINIWNVLTDQSIFRTLPYTVDFYQPRIKFWATFLLDSSGIRYCPRANMALLTL